MIESKPKIYDPDFLPTTIYSGVPSWLNLSVIENDADLELIDAAVIGIPWEGGVTIGGYSSTTDGPKAIRDVSIRYTGYLPDFDLDSLDYIKIADYGDVAVQNGNYDFTFDSIREKVAKVLDSGAFPIVFGGDHGGSLPVIEEVAKRNPQKIGILHFDSHLDNYESFGDDLYARCSPFYRMYENPNIDPKNIVHIGIRGPRNHQDEFNNAKKFGAKVILARDVHENGWKKSINDAISTAFDGTDVVIVTVCADALDAAFMPQGPQDMGGLTSYQLLMMLREAGLAGAKGFDFMEIYPDTNSLQTAAHVANWAALYYLNGLAEHIKNKE